MNGTGPATRVLGGICGLVGDSCGLAPRSAPRGHDLVTGLELAGGVRRPLSDSCGRPEPTRRDADQTLEVMREMALVREASARRNLCQGEVAILSKELLRTLDATGDDVLVRRLPCRDLELPREVVGAEVGDCRHVLQGQAGVEVFFDILDDRAELRWTERSVSRARGPTGS